MFKPDTISPHVMLKQTPDHTFSRGLAPANVYASPETKFQLNSFFSMMLQAIVNHAKKNVFPLKSHMGSDTYPAFSLELQSTCSMPPRVQRP